MLVVKVAQLQSKVFADKRESLEHVESLMEKAGAVDFIALPEMFCCPYQVDCFPVYAEEEGGETWEKCSMLAKKYNVYLSAGSVPEISGGKIYNTAYVFDRKGKQIGKHRKMHLFDIDVKGGQQFKESDTLTAGNSVTVFNTEFGLMGLCVCYDFRFPELGRLMSLKGAQIIFVPAAFNMTTGPAHWEIMFRSQALNNQVYALGTAPARDTASSYISWGHTIAADPWGHVISQMEESEGIQKIDLDLCRIAEIRQQLPLTAHRRTDVYSLTD